jgi:hypothetical protein
MTVLKWIVIVLAVPAVAMRTSMISARSKRLDISSAV